MGYVIFMGNENWYKVDNVANVFLASVTKRDTRTLRVSCTLKEKIDPSLLQSAVLSAASDRPQMQVRIRRGLFWNYMESTDIKPVVEEEHDRVCPLLYIPATAMLHYKVTYFDKRINLELFHAISDGTGAIEFLNIIVLYYLRLKYPGKLEDVTIHSGASANDLGEDSFRQFFEKPGLPGGPQKKAFHPGTLKLPYDQLQFFEIHIPVDKILPKAKDIKVSLTSYISAAWMLAIYSEMPSRKRKMPVTVTLPVNLRNYYPSKTARNFFTNISVTHIFDKSMTIEELAPEFDAAMKQQLSEENIKKVMDGFETIEHVTAVRLAPLPIKRLVMRHATRIADRNVSVIVSNLGVQKPPEEVGEYIDNYSAYCSSQNLFSTMSSYNGDLTLGVSSPFVNTDAVQNLVRLFTDMGIEVTVYATEVIV